MQNTDLDPIVRVKLMERISRKPHNHMKYYKFNGTAYGKNFWKCVVCDQIITRPYGWHPKKVLSDKLDQSEESKKPKKSKTSGYADLRKWFG